MARAGRQWQMTARVLCALALLFLSFAHQPAGARQLTPAMTAQYMLPDGSIGDICFGSDGVEGHNFPHEGLVPVCDYCRLTAAIDLPPPADESYLIVRVVGMAAESPDVAPVFVAHPRTLPQSRAPPLSA
ncbi:hypothetical protein OIU34_01180 [Pararhizobium sp. BT-229]|uniref:hypothetical protein n=1 Tax=Pararhizobium sp. BT-229 TaxID=2986923 RepID=UPI0021F6D3A6|nr:hypothetical protein [Pararhizobium sp. BT-229]MCV9960494.1 hypothetical protein [Pararhizobium sp. BT-229]